MVEWDRDDQKINDIIVSMLKEGTAAAARDNEGAGLLHYAKDDEDLAHQLIEAGCDVNLKSKGQYTPLMLAIESRHQNLVKILLEAGARHDVVYPYGGSTPMTSAGFYGNVDIVRSLIKAGADVNSIDGKKSTALHAAIGEIDTYLDDDTIGNRKTITLSNKTLDYKCRFIFMIV